MSFFEDYTKKEPAQVAYEWDVPRPSNGCLGATVGAVAVLLATLGTAWLTGPSTQDLTCSRPKDLCVLTNPGGYDAWSGMPRSARVEQGSTTASCRVVLETWKDPVATSEVRDVDAAERFAAEVAAFIQGDDPELRTSSRTPGHPFAPIWVFVSGVVTLLAWWVKTVRGSLDELVRLR